VKVLRTTLVTLALVLAMAAPASAAKWTPAKLAKAAHGDPFACKVSHSWGPKQNKCALLVVNRDKPWLGRESIKIAGCETGGKWNEDAGKNDGGFYKGLGQFAPGTWRSLPKRLAKHSPFSPVWMGRAMRYLRLKDGDWHQWPYCSQHAL